jgi:hypothetical protein
MILKGDKFKALDLGGKSPESKLFGNRIWSVKDVANYTGYSVGTLYNLTSKNLIPHQKKRGEALFHT